MSLDPGELGWQEFWLRIGVVVFVLGCLATVVMFIVKVILTVVDLVRWVAERINGKGEEEEMNEAGARRALLRLVPQDRRGRAAGLLQTVVLFSARSQEKVFTEGVYVSEYEGQPPRVHTSLEAAQAACEGHLKSEVEPPGRWDWVPDDCGLVMRQSDMDSGWPGPALLGRVTRTVIES